MLYNFINFVYNCIIQKNSAGNKNNTLKTKSVLVIKFRVILDSSVTNGTTCKGIYARNLKLDKLRFKLLILIQICNDFLVIGDDIYLGICKIRGLQILSEIEEYMWNNLSVSLPSSFSSFNGTFL